MYHLITVSIVLLIPNNCYSASTLLSSITVMEAGSFLQYITDVGDDLISCDGSFFYNNEEISFSLATKSTTVSKPQNFVDTNDIFKRLFSLGQNLCGFKLTNWFEDDPTNWTLTTIDSLNNRNQAPFTVVQYNQNMKYTVTKVTPGVFTTISCGVTDGTESKDFCKIFNPSGKLILTNTNCRYSFIVTMTDIGKWRCLAGVHYNMDLVEYIIELFVDDVTYTTSWVTETDDDYSLGCEIVNDRSTSAPLYCIITNPSGEDYVIRPGRTTDRYNTVTTNLGDRKCGIEIPKPLKESESGVWKCRIGNRGKILHLTEDRGKRIPSLKYEKNYTISTNLGASLEIGFEIPNPIIYCQITAPNGERLLPNKNVFELGECAYVTVVSNTHIGMWIYSFVQESTSNLEEILIEVKITDLLVYDEELSADENENLVIHCKTGGSPGIPVRYCLVKTPENVSYYVHDNLNTSEIAYIGDGLNYGDCTVRLNKITSQHSGNWSCIAYLGDKEVTGNISVTVKSTLSETTMGLVITVGVLLGILLTAIIITFTYKAIRNRAGGNPETVIFSRNSTGRGSGEELATVNVPNYTTDLRQRR